MGADVLIRLLDRTADAAFASNRDGVICVWNRSAEELFGYSAAEALKMPCSELLSCQSTSRPKLCSDQCGVITHCLFGHSVPNFDMKAKLLSGAWIWINVSILVFEREADRDLFVVHLVRDITQRKELEQLNAQLVRVAKQIVQAPQPNDKRAPTVPLSDQEKAILRETAPVPPPQII